MKYLDTKKKKSFIITSILFVILLFCFLFRINFIDPPPENGIHNFGTTEFGSGNIQQPIQSAPQPTAAKQLPQVKTEILSQDIEEAVMKAVKAQPTKQVATEEVKPKPKESLNHQSTSDALPV
jgi:hypothetical protein